jgi:hypothetical protein
VRKDYDFSNAKRGAVIPSKGKTRITIMLDDDVLEHFRAKAEEEGTGYQTMINSVLRAVLVPPRRKVTSNDKPLTVAVLRKVLREELFERTQ